MVDRIRTAIEKNDNFYIMVLIPLLPGFTGEVDQSEATFLKVIMHWQYRAIFRHRNSLLRRVSLLTDHPEKYIKFYSLRGHGKINGIPKTEMIYIHSKLMIIDDTTVILGSANINDRSMNGDRDSEICILVEG